MVAEIGRVRIVTNGWVGAPGLSQLYFAPSAGNLVAGSDSLNAVTAIRTFYDAIKTLFPSAWTATVEPIVQIIEATTGALYREESVAAPAVVTGSGLSGYGSTATGVLASWHTATVFNGRLLRGRTFLTPTNKDSYETTGQIVFAKAATVQAAGATLAASTTANVCVWHRPSPNPAAANGGFGDIVGCSVSTLETILRSRRD